MTLGGSRALTLVTWAMTVLAILWIIFWAFLAIGIAGAPPAEFGGPPIRATVISLAVALAMILGGCATIWGCRTWRLHLRRVRDQTPGFPVLPTPASR